MENLEINHNLLSAYIDNDVSEEERVLIEIAIDNDPQIAWEVATLQHTVSMLHELSKSDYPLFTKPLKTVQFKSSKIKPIPVKSSPVKSSLVKLRGHNQTRHIDLGEMESQVWSSLNFSKKVYAEQNTDGSISQKFKLAQQIFWQLGSPFWRGIAIIGLLLFLLLLGSDLLFSLVPRFKTFWTQAQNTTQLGISTIQSTSTTIGLGIHRTYLLIIYLIISLLTFMSTMLWWRSNPYH